MPGRLLSTLAILALSLLIACSTQRTSNLPLRHPAEAELGRQRPICTDCHEARSATLAYAEFNHDPLFAEGHRSIVSRSSRVCTLCHQQSFCNDCHATHVELTPALKNQTDTDRRLPHRGDFLSRHRIDGRVDPTSCYRCHGNPKAARTCAPCHG